MEIFKTVYDFSDYEISNYGRVKTKARPIRYTHAVTRKEHFRNGVERYLKVHFNERTGYKFVQLYKRKKMFNKTIHRLVALTFLPTVLGNVFVNHKDGNKQNNIVENLEWCTDKYNHEHATKTGLKAKGTEIGSSKLNQKCVNAIRKMLADGISHSKISKWFDVSRATISFICNKKTWNSVSQN